MEYHHVTVNFYVATPHGTEDEIDELVDRMLHASHVLQPGVRSLRAEIVPGAIVEIGPYEEVTREEALRSPSERYETPEWSPGPEAN